MLLAQAESIPAAPILAIMAFGVLLATGGHIWKSRGVVAMGLAILFLATAAMVVGGYAAYQGDESDPRDECTAQNPCHDNPPPP